MGFASFIGTRFGRRLLLIAALFALGLITLTGQTARLTVFQTDELREAAEAKLVRLTWSPTVRGQIRDRKGRVLAFDRPSYDVAIRFDVISGEWAAHQAAEAAQNSPGWDTLSPEQREQAILDRLPEFSERSVATRQAIARETGLSITEIDARCLAAQDEVGQLIATVRDIRKVNELREYAGNLGITREELDRRVAGVDRADLLNDAARLRHVLASEITVEVEDSIRRDVEEPLREESAPHVIVPAVDDEVGFRLRRLAAEKDGEGDPLYPGLVVLSSHAREYPLRIIDVELDGARLPAPLRRDGPTAVAVRGVASHLLGTVRRRVFREDVVRRAEAIDQDSTLARRAIIQTPTGPRDLGRYVPGRDSIGHTGLERSLEDQLRGLRGIEIDRLDEAESERQPAVAGRDTTLTLDIMLQARIQALLDPAVGLAAVQPWHANTERADPDDPTSPLLMPVGTPMNAAAVVIEVDTGEILALVSTPSFMPDGSHLPASRAERERFIALRQPAINRAVSTPLPPGSIAKAMVLCGAHARGLVHTGERIACTGHFLPNAPNRLRCWIYKTY
ncbi:MAG: penicillin-binding transpeptidase domain-containing protein, partial [Planctomycetota bacterium]